MKWLEQLREAHRYRVWSSRLAIWSCCVSAGFLIHIVAAFSLGLYLYVILPSTVSVVLISAALLLDWKATSLDKKAYRSFRRFCGLEP